MNNANLLSKSAVKGKSKTIKLLVFAIGNLNAALSIDTVQKVINYSAVTGSGLNHYGLVNIGNKEITVIDLHQQLFNVAQTLNPDDKRYLLLVTNSAGETFGIIIKNSPELYDVKLEMIRALPNSYRHADTLKIASHVFMTELDVEQPQEQKTIFILEPDELISPI